MWDENIHFALVISMSMSQLLIAQYLIGIVYAIEYQPLGLDYRFDLPYNQNPLYSPLQFEVPRWVLIDKIDYPNCRLTHQDNFRFEEHIAIIGSSLDGSLNGTYDDPRGHFALYPRYYIKKRLTSVNQIQIVALINPQANSLGPQNPPRFRQQLLSIVCGRKSGRIETIDPNSRVYFIRRNATRRMPGACGIEERLIEICFGDSDVGSLRFKDYLFAQDLNYPEPNRDHVLNHQILAEWCHRFYIIDLPSATTNNLSLRVMSEIILYYLKGGQRAGLDRVMMNGLGLGNQCQPEHLGWDNFFLNELVTDEILRRNLLEKTTNEHRPAWNNRHTWFFCKID